MIDSAPLPRARGSWRVATRTTKDIDLGRDDDEQTAIRDITAAQQLALDDYFTFAATRTYELEDTDEFSAACALATIRCASTSSR